MKKFLNVKESIGTGAFLFCPRAITKSSFRIFKTNNRIYVGGKYTNEKVFCEGQLIKIFDSKIKA